MIRALRFVILVSVVTLAIRGAEPILKITSPEKTLTFTAEEFAALPRTDLKLPAQADQKERAFSAAPTGS